MAASSFTVKAQMKSNTSIRSRGDFDCFFEKFFEKLNVDPDYRRYFHQHADRLWLTANRFGLFSRRFESLLEIGPGFGFLPFLWKMCLADDVAIFEGEAPELLEFRSAFQECGIEAAFGDLFKIFGQRNEATNRLPFPDGRFDCVVCWETMEHFNFNPIPFLNDLKRMTRSGGSLFLTVPNQAKLDFRLKLLFGKSVRTSVNHYSLQMDDRNRMQYGPHWREYTLGEFVELLRRTGFHIVRANHLHTFINRPDQSFAVSIKRSLARIATRLVPSFSTLCVVEARNP